MKEHQKGNRKKAQKLTFNGEIGVLLPLEDGQPHGTVLITQIKSDRVDRTTELVNTGGWSSDKKESTWNAICEKRNLVVKPGGKTLAPRNADGDFVPAETLKLSIPTDEMPADGCVTLLDELWRKHCSRITAKVTRI